jgi:hypothetical protein
LCLGFKKNSTQKLKPILVGFSAILFLYIQAQEVKASPVLKLEKTNFDAEVETGVVFVKVGHFNCFFFFNFLLTMFEKNVYPKKGTVNVPICIRIVPVFCLLLSSIEGFQC